MWVLDFFTRLTIHLVYRPEQQVGGHAYSVLAVPYMEFLDVHVLD